MTEMLDENQEPGCSTKKRDKKVKKRKKSAYRRLVAQMEFYFSDANLRQSKFLAKIYADDPWVPLTTFLTFNKISALLAELEVIGGEKERVAEVEKALRVIQSSSIVLSEDGTKVSRVNAFQSADKEQIESRTIYVENLSQDADHDSLTKLFSEFGEVVYVSIPRFYSQRNKGFAFVEFAGEDAVKAVLVAMDKVQGDLASIKSFQQEDKTKAVKGNKRKLEELGDTDEVNKAKKVKSVSALSSPAEIASRIEDDSYVEKPHSDLKVLSKEQWRKLRNKYLNEQRKNFSAAKATLKNKRLSPSRENCDANQASLLPTKVPDDGDGVKEITMVPGLIVKIVINDGVDNVQHLKKRIREALNGESVAYVDARIGANESWVRCTDRDQAERLVQVRDLGEGTNLCLLAGDDENAYWEKIKKDREDKRSGNITVSKIKNKKKIVQKIEALKSSHVYFD